ncbi:bifunctional glutamate N-acetyltransferase/amino-acid acetyltransferase ArgJ [Jannaschia sp. W003]|uniref:bifunctional glutamate N-acetyltransferase/amino-acid acetyltransferase ArgJ n=1 Tax=Jannaschia sp. W003 TaxID=2867012 RepID=UPI0021A43FF8|nr:bifunctional glutamate N-acetyltransferase/amino-acid acetyltransferase ArgJ [Jannaschia sp. W003]UWQ21955.1 bifunctional glutamate N-acetyltransferase/amino-acid acetyltransferase ArgJ [Jannaschia sp. W003]
MGKRKKIEKLERKLAKAERRLAGAAEALAGPKGPLVSPLAPPFPELPAIEGLRFAAGSAGVKYKGRTDVMLALLDPGTAMAGAFTRSATRSAAVLDGQRKLAEQKGAAGWAILVNSGNANAFTGAAGMASVGAVAQAVAQATGLPATRVVTSSTGVIGEPLPHDRIVAAVEGLVAELDADGMAGAARAIMTTDTFPKGSVRTLDLDGETVTVAGIAKGSGMIAPDMATMLAYVFTDARVAQPLLQRMVSNTVGDTFNAVTVDGDTSTSDTLLVAATHKRGPEMKAATSHAARAFREALHAVMHDLALQIAMDGEGATKLVEVHVTGAKSPADARLVASAIANSPLVKTAIAGEDANWGRVVAAVGKSGAEADRDRLAIRFGDVVVAQEGARAPDYSEEAASAYMRGDRILLGVDLGLGDGEARMWGCDLTYRYVEINADYRS